MKWSEFLGEVNDLFMNTGINYEVFELRKDRIKKCWTKGNLNPEECFEKVFSDLLF